MLEHLSKTKQLKNIIDQIVSGNDHIAFDPCLESFHTDMGRAKHYFGLGCYDKAAHYSERVLSHSPLTEHRKKRFTLILKDSRKYLANGQLSQ